VAGSKLYFVRHAKAGERRLWAGDDIDRPLSKQGHKQAELVGKRLAKLEPSLLYSSPYVRCVQTLEPLADRLGTTLQIERWLSEGEPIEPLIELLGELAPGAVMCSHGDIIPATLQALERTGTKLRGPSDWRKASVWVLERNKKGVVVEARVWPPPAT
jgi:8-oxo-dGTP diphosphatase